MPDDYPWSPGGQRALLVDQAELAARIGALAVYDRRGQVIWWDRSLGGLSPWIVAVSGTGAFVHVKTDPSYFGPYCMELRTGSDGGLVARISHQFSTAEVNRWGLEAAVNFATEFDEFRLELTRFDGTQGHNAFLAIDRTAGEIQFLKDDGTYQAVAALSDPVDLYGIYHHLKIVGDFAADKYVRLLYNEVEYDLSAYSLRLAAAPDIAQQRVTLRHLGRSGQNDKALVGSVILTVGEP
jgi:hypothetical protein